jgi:hypothetical protein
MNGAARAARPTPRIRAIRSASHDEATRKPTTDRLTNSETSRRWRVASP